MEQKLYKEEIQEQFIKRDFITGRKKFNELNRKDLDERKMDMIFNEWCYEAGDIDAVS